MKEQFQDNTYSLLKAMHHTKIALDYYEDVAKNYETGAKHLMMQYAKKCDWILNDIKYRIPQEMMNEINNDMKDSLFLDAIESDLIHFDATQRELIEQIISLMAKGEKIEVSYLESH
jgi:hypothetical protein